MLANLTGLLLRRRRVVLLVAVLLALVGGALSATLFDKMKAGGFDDPGAESGRAADVLAEDFGREDLNLALLVRAQDSVDDPATAAAGEELSRRLAEEDGVAEVFSYWLADRAPQLRAENGDKALILAAVEGDDTEAGERLTELEPHFEGEQAGGLHVEIGGTAMINRELGELSERDAVRGEMLAFPILLVILVLIFGSLVAAALPLIVGALTIMLSMGMMWALAGVTDLSVFAVNVVTLLGLGLAVDYSLLMVNRYREELAAGRQPAAAIRVMMLSAGRTVVFSAVTVAVTLAGLAWFPLLALRSMAYAGIAVAVLTAVVTLTVLPALLALLGPRVEAGRLFRRRGAAAAAAPGAAGDVANGFWHRLASFVMRRPVPVATLGVLVLLLLGSPFLGIKMGTADERGLPESSAGRQVAETLRAEFDSGESQALNVVLPGTPADSGEVPAYAAEVSALAGVARVDTVTGSYAQGTEAAPPGARHEDFAARDGGGVHLSVVPEPNGTAAVEDLVREIRDLPAPGEALVGGQTAVNMDGIDSILDRLPVAGLTLVVTMVILLFLLTGSALLPFLAMLLSGLGLTATFGALVWGFQDGHLSGLLGFTTTGDVVGTVPVLLFAVAFALGMDYQVFMLSRIREEYEHTGDPTAAVAVGLERIGRIVTAAAAALSVVFLAFLISDISFMMAMGVGLPLAVLMDATLIRGVLLPATMRLGGRAIWWLPPGLQRVHRRFGLHEHVPPPATDAGDAGDAGDATDAGDAGERVRADR
ncbi:MMPL family transporter [Streptomyces sp. MP131-18]|uniref:MMPL family transporter n=1 Tax=Streptomyces sp. MP131-18 TaxID=1857892 RepID=UPI00097BB12B|nr:MMPL family transporter [Streptomyces sp. MP131-18]ONK14098.1 Membrane protein YdfJ [Streptomyces sp. MP131-18]